MAKKRPAKKRRGERIAKVLVGLIEAGRLRLARNLANRTMVFADHPAHPAIHLPLDHPDFEGWLYKFVLAETGLLLHRQEVNRLLRLLSGYARENTLDRITDGELTRVLLTEPVVAVVYEFMSASTKNPLEERGQDLWKTLYAYAEEHRLLVLGRRHFPRGPQVFSRVLKKKDVVEPLKRLGIEFEIIRNNGCHIKLRRLDAPSDEASAQSSAPKSPDDQSLQRTDAREALREKILRLHQNRQPPSSERGNS